MDNSNLHVITEVGVFGELNITDPTKKKVKKTDTELDVLIEESIKTNANILVEKV